MDKVVVKNLDEYQEKNNNRFLGVLPKMDNSLIVFQGSGNIIYCEKNVTLKNSKIECIGNDNLIYLSSNRNVYLINVSIFNNSVLYFGKNNYMNGTLNLILSERKHIIIGEECLFSFGIWVRLADPHLIYDSEQCKRINLSKSVYMGDHIWIGQNAMIMKGSVIGSGSIIGAMSLVANKKVPSNTIWGGNPAKCIREKIFWKGNCVHKYTKNDSLKYDICKSDEFIYEHMKEEKIDFKIIENELDELSVGENIAEKHLDYILNTLVIVKKNRFYL